MDCKVRQGILLDDSILTKALAWLFPPRCVLCRQPLDADGWCNGCKRDLPRITTRCVCCSIPLSSTRLCGACQRQPPHFDASHAPLRYQPPVDRLIQQFKYRHRLALTLPLATLIAESVDLTQATPEVLLPVPLHPRRLRRRGYNQAVELARAVGRLLDLPVDCDWIRRSRATASQAELPLHERRANLRGAFAVSGAAPYRRVAVVDDVMTSGATADEMARVVRAAGVEWIAVWTLARA